MCESFTIMAMWHMRGSVWRWEKAIFQDTKDRCVSRWNELVVLCTWLCFGERGKQMIRPDDNCRTGHWPHVLRDGG